METTPAADLVVGPGNLYVTEAKRQAYGKVGIDFVAGQSEVLIIADEVERLLKDIDTGGNGVAVLGGAGRNPARRVPRRGGGVFQQDGTNHTLPTMGAARYTGGLWVGAFLKTCTWQKIAPEGVEVLAPAAEVMAQNEGLSAHALAARLRRNRKER
jgi:histidinol dehydrogenase